MAIKRKTKKKVSKRAKKGKLIEFYGTECPHCRAMDAPVARLERELGVKVEKYEVWHNEKNAQLLLKYDKGFCGGVPFFYNEATGEWICGEATYEQLKAWALGKKK